MVLKCDYKNDAKGGNIIKAIKYVMQMKWLTFVDGAGGVSFCD